MMRRSECITAVMVLPLPAAKAGDVHGAGAAMAGGRLAASLRRVLRETWGIRRLPIDANPIDGRDRPCLSFGPARMLWRRHASPILSPKQASAVPPILGGSVV